MLFSHPILYFPRDLTQPQVLPLGARHDGSMTDKHRKLVQGSIGLCVSPATDGAISRLQEAIDARKIFLEARLVCLRCQLKLFRRSEGNSQANVRLL